MSKNLIFQLKMAKNGKNWSFLAKNGQTRIFFKNPLGTFFQTHQDVALCKKSSKSDAWISRYGVTHGRTHARTHERESIGPSANAERPKMNSAISIYSECTFQQNPRTFKKSQAIFKIFWAEMPPRRTLEFSQFCIFKLYILGLYMKKPSVSFRKNLVLAVLALFGLSALAEGPMDSRSCVRASVCPCATRYLEIGASDFS